MDFLESSIVVQKQLGMKHRSKMGIFFTPKPLRDIVFQHIPINPQSVLEPSCGSGEFLVECETRFPTASITGVELDETLASISKENTTRSTIYTQDFLTFDEGKFDLIIGNPPFVQMKTVNKQASSGRSNLYIEILFKCMTQHLNDNGVLAMVIPSTIMNGHFSQPTRELILSKKILHFETIREHTFKDTKAGVSILVIQNTPGDNLNYNFEGIITEDALELTMMTSGLRRLKDFDVFVKYGMMTKTLQDYFSRNPEHIPFVLKKDLCNKEIRFDKDRLFIDKQIKTHSGKCILMLRSNGVVMGSEYILRFSMFESESFLFDICLVGIFGPDIDKVYDSLCDIRTSQYLQKVCGSGRLTKNIIMNLPIFRVTR
ncbi:DNA methyltransferase [Paramecium bursaria Chlorella virus SC1A]|uniref:site-specific DNA-methyltransferase (adenine-specific) n=1 Tax=Paramecium bursaria Chlorella virus SC1A TaxID=51374 RepID=Q96717_9PHYC|nr:DNA methyltransferase [Paramecium bursaria Chlorella virus SC1A]AAC57943.1 DNA adenine methyltransferase [Paramecium bursaria Chlorella virus SC1A]